MIEITLGIAASVAIAVVAGAAIPTIWVIVMECIYIRERRRIKRRRIKRRLMGE